MAGIDVDQWLEQWTEAHIRTLAPADQKADMRDAARACAEGATAAGITIAELKVAADDDLETYLVQRRNAV